MCDTFFFSEKNRSMYLYQLFKITVSIAVNLKSDERILYQAKQ